MTEGETDAEKVEEALELLQEAGFNDIVVVGKAFGKRVSTTVFHDNYDFDDIAEIQGYLQQEMIDLSVKSITERDINSESKGDSK